MQIRATREFKAHIEEWQNQYPYGVLIITNEVIPICIKCQPALKYQINFVNDLTEIPVDEFVQNENTDIPIPIYVKFDPQIRYPFQLILGVRWTGHHSEPAIIRVDQ